MNGFIRSIIFIVIIIVVLILSQQPYFAGWGRGVYLKIEMQGKALWQKAMEYWNKYVLRRVTTEIEKREEIAKEEIKGQVEKTSQTLWQKIKDYILGLLKGLFNLSLPVPETNK